MDAKPFLLAQHLWMKGVDPAGIATRLGLPVRMIIAYLAGRDDTRIFDPPQFDARLEWMVDQAFARASPYGVVIEVDKRHRGDVTIRCEIVDERSFERLACIRRFAASDAWISGRCDLVSLLEPVAETAWAWWDRVRERLVGLDFHTLAVRLPSYPRAEAMGRRRPDLRPLATLLNDLLDRISPRRSGTGRRDERIELRREMGQDRLYHCCREADRAGSSETRLTQRDQPEAWRRIKAVLVSQGADIRALGDFTVGIKGR
ncbi:MAG: hypothetical protein EON55_00200 [Alphaproteobacteria bacterium]|nr:MAG: hypothetical protein EON55_00200 [Alphaproteobacteria bacterium]